MEHYGINYLIGLGKDISPEILSIIFLLTLYGFILFLWHFFYKEGLFLYNAIAVVIANIQVLKHSSFIFSSQPVALGTILFATTFLVNDILTEHEGVTTANTSIKLSILAQIMTTLVMLFTLCYPSLGDAMGENPVGTVVDKIQSSLYTIFAPSVRILTASIISYYISQRVDIKIYQILKNFTHKKFVWLRLNLSSTISGLLDNIIFSTLAWVILTPNPVNFKTLVLTYILGTYVSRLLVSISSTPIIYLSYKIK